ncbi:hypothetical protein B0H15DRAFT_831227 [Mycena belliarum]|uniref:Uncharacterized protein n=1 Tax=Mycena belliarum TaxID=1033014 RepID=A0AAD6XUJ9_9AGAR|nr:hypothetical protein B0H15DRAFT_831227 [Mycena belliae]
MVLETHTSDIVEPSLSALRLGTLFFCERNGDIDWFRDHSSSTRDASPFSRIPEEVVEYIAECMRYPIHPRLEATEAFLSEGRTRFSSTRFSLSSFSQVCISVRFAVERLLYRDIHVDTIGWTRHLQSYDTQKHPIWPAGCLRLLLRTFEARPELRRFVRSVDLRWCEPQHSPGTIREQLQFLGLCPGLQVLSFSCLPETVLDHLESLKLRITSFAAVSPAANLPRIIRMFPSLENLHLHLQGYPGSFSIPNHSLSRLHLKLVADWDIQEQLLKLAFAVPGLDVRDFYLEGVHTMSASSNFPRPTAAMQACVQHLCLKNINPFRSVKINGEECLPLAEMTALRHLHVMRPFLLPAHAFTCLPPNLRSLTFSDYALDSKRSSADSKSRFVQSVIECLNLCARNFKLAGIKTYGAVPDDPWELGDLTPMRLLCRKQNVPFIQIGAYADIEPELMIFFK